MSGGNGSVVWSTGRLAYCVLWLDQETEDKVAVGLIAIEQLRRSSSNYYYTSKKKYFPKMYRDVGMAVPKPQQLGVETGHTNTAQITLFFMHNVISQ